MMLPSAAPMILLFATVNRKQRETGHPHSGERGSPKNVGQMAYQRGRYFYRSRRRGSRVVREYLGSGTVGQLAAEFYGVEEAERREERRACQQQIEFDSRLEQNLQTVTDAIKGLTEAVLLCSGHHNHKGQWRKLRG